MEIQYSTPVLVTGAIIAQGGFAALVLWFNRQNRTSSRLLALLLVAISLWMVDNFWSISGIYGQNPDFYFKPIYYSFAFGPLVYFYVKSLTNADFRLQQSHFWHFIPVLLQAGLYTWLSFQSYALRRWYWYDVHQPYTYRIEFNGTFLSLAVYLIFSLLLLRRYRNWLNDNYSEQSKIRLHWLRIVLSLMLLLCAVWFVELILREFFDLYYHYSITALGISTLVLAFGGIRQGNLSHIRFTESAPQSPNPNLQLDPTIITRIKSYMEENRAFLNPSLSLKEFAADLDLPARTVSQHINHGLGQSFIDFVNTYRVAAVKSYLDQHDQQTFTLLAIALDAGFNSKSSFNRIFKKFTGLTPREYAKRSQSGS